jgi:KaiC/GvpD/RAD55 family RecA-like ATPase
MANKELAAIPSQVPKNTPALLNPVEAIQEEIEKAKRAPKRVGLLSIKSANAWIEDSLRAPDPKMYFHDLIVQFENTVIFASSNVGKSILAIQIAEDIAHEEKILYVDLELSGKQFQMRYTDPSTGEIHIFPSNFSRAEIDPELIVGADLEQEILDSVEEAAKQGTHFFVIDNITFICNDSEKGSTAGSFMMKLIRLKKKYNLTTIVIAHTPKRRGWEPITQNDLAGSAKLINFFDAGIALARSAKDNNLRYLKQVKVRTGEYQYDAENVIVYDVVKTDGFLKFEFQGYAKEDDHLKNRESSDDYDEIQAILRLKKEGKTIRQIAEEMDMASTTVHRRLRKAEKEGITLEEASTESVPPVPSVPRTEQVEQTEHVYEMKLPYKD